MNDHKINNFSPLSFSDQQQRCRDHNIILIIAQTTVNLLIQILHLNCIPTFSLEVK